MVVKFADDTTVIRLILNYDEAASGEEVSENVRGNAHGV